MEIVNGLKVYTVEEINIIIELHKEWFNDDKDGVRADLSSANLSYADLRYANLRYVIGEMRSLRSFQIEKYMISYTDTILNIGYQSHTIEEWKNFDDEKIKSMDNIALEWWNKWKTILFQIIEMSPAEDTGYVEKDN